MDGGFQVFFLSTYKMCGSVFFLSYIQLQVLQRIFRQQKLH